MLPCFAKIEARLAKTPDKIENFIGFKNKGGINLFPRQYIVKATGF